MDIKKTHLELAHSETAVLNAASRIFAAYVGNGEVNGQNEDELMEKAVHDAVKLACAVELVVQSDGELG